MRLTTRRVWPATIAHDAGNGYWGTFTALTITASPVTLEYLVGETGLLPLLATAVVAGWLLHRLSQEPRAARHGIAPQVEANA